VTKRAGDLEVISFQVADGQPVDWEEALSGATDDHERNMIASLRVIESVAQLPEAPGSPSETGVPGSNADLRSTATLNASTAPSSFHLGTWAHLEVREKLGEGGFAEVYRAWDSRLDREVALKLLKADGSPAKASASRVIKEGRFLARLRHPNVVTVYGAETHGGRIGLWMELVRGRSLEQVLADRGPFGAREAALIGIDLCRALSAVHRAGVVHRDVKAQNVMREEGGRIVLMDFGAGIEVAGEGEERDTTISGTPLYLAPELFGGESATERSDVYSLGVLLYRLVTGAFPIEATSWSELHGKHARREATLLRDRRSDLPDTFVKVVERATAWEPHERFATAGAMEQSLSFALGTESGATGAQTITPVAELQRQARSSVSLAFTSLGVLAAGILVVGLLFVWSMTRGPVPETPSGAVPAQTQVQRPGGAGAGIAPSYSVDAVLYRTPANSDRRERLEQGSRLALGDRLNLEFTASKPLHVYVINEDDAGHAYSLFPLPGLEPGNPLPADKLLLLPGSRGGKPISWAVNSPGGREHLMILASPTRLVEFEAAMNGLARAGEDAVAIPETAKSYLRGIGGLAEGPATSTGTSAISLFEMAQELASRTEVVNGVWLRRVELESPRPK
jgi:serine/threonine-protein kinase